MQIDDFIINKCDKLDDVVNKYNNTYHKTIKMKPVDVKDNIYTDFNKEGNDKDAKFKIGDYIRISKCKNIFGKGYTPNPSEDISMIKKVKNIVPWKYFVQDLNVEESLERFIKKNCKILIKRIKNRESN